jgi:hypothetical protein
MRQSSLKNINWVKPLSQSGFTALAIISCTVSIVGIQHWRLQGLNKTVQAKNLYAQEERQQELSLALQQRLSKNSFSNLIADWAFLQFLQYFGDDDARKVTNYSLNPEFLSSVVIHDPRFVDAYLFMSPTITLYSGRPDRAVDLMGKGLDSLSPKVKDAYYIWLYRATDQLLFLGDSSAARRSYLVAADWARQENPKTPEGIKVAESAQSTASFLQHSPQSKSVQISAWLMLLSNTKNDERVQQYVVRRLQALGVKVKISETGDIKFESSRSGK